METSVRQAVERFEQCSRNGFQAGGPGFDEIEQTALRVAFAAGLKAGAEIFQSIVLSEDDAFEEMARFYEQVGMIMVEATVKVQEMAARN